VIPRNGYGLQHYNITNNELYPDLWAVYTYTGPGWYAAGRKALAQWFPTIERAQFALKIHATNARVVPLERPPLMVLFRRELTWMLVRWAKKLWPHPLGY
jgi:hypothetical protein